MQVTGQTAPPLVARSEISAYAPIRVALGSRLVILHYRACTLYSIIGGTVVPNPSGLDVSAGSVESETPTVCPQVYRISAEAVPGAVLMRGLSLGVPRGLSLPAQLTLAVAGADAPMILAVDLLDESGGVVVRGNAAGLRASLQPGRRYRVWIAFGERRSLEVPFTATAHGSPGYVVLDAG